MTEPDRVTRAGAELSCDHCGHDRFRQANTFQKFAAPNKVIALLRQQPCTTYICDRCSKMHWFYDRR